MVRFEIRAAVHALEIYKGLRLCSLRTSPSGSAWSSGNRVLDGRTPTILRPSLLLQIPKLGI